jgi:hypothetical protein
VGGAVELEYALGSAQRVGGGPFRGRDELFADTLLGGAFAGAVRQQVERVDRDAQARRGWDRRREDSDAASRELVGAFGELLPATLGVSVAGCELLPRPSDR